MKYLLMVIIMASLFLAGCGEDGESTSMSSPTALAEPTSVVKTNADPIDTLLKYIESINTENLESMVSCFTDGYYSEKMMAAVEEKFSEGKATILNVETTLVSESALKATIEVTYDTMWQTANDPVDKSYVRDIVKLVNVEGEWLIRSVSEKDRTKVIEF